MILAFAPLFWVGGCLVSVGLAQRAYDDGIVPNTRMYRVANGPRARVAPPRMPGLGDRHVLTELEKYVRVWSLEPGACAEFPDAARFPWSWNPFRASATMLRLKQKQSFLMREKHQVERFEATPGRVVYYLAPDPGAALGGRAFLVETEGQDLLRAWELPR